ncbi:Tim44/TimA family putative adaptor protein [Anaplasma capra]|uniref:Tim44/TimA family putative adaptor protein n=1 Tax=Anaplasma capra TaxID=1562740 RepID=UPI0021D5D9FF|nr:Tim44/TimA family putative adaptor protein [Anaplasma capra]MCU7611752.1 Tim44/TimA family putative adaptor protein [Anaplasma capra]MCU7612497.1 Tim44/TimA family putative adaptor protein [Anaplasma capra]
MVELAIYAFVAAFIFFRLYSSLGKASSVSLQPSAIYPEQVVDEQSASDGSIASQDTLVSSVVEESEHSDQVLGTLGTIKERSRDFSVKHFMEGSAAAFEAIVKALNKGNAELLSSLLNKSMYSSFVREMERRKSAGRVHEDVVVSVTSQKITNAELKGNLAAITVRFLTEQINVIRDTEGNVVDGSVSKISVIEDTWRFERDITTAGRKWYLASTSA